MVFVVFRRFHQNRCIRCQTSPDLSSNGFFSPRNRHIRRQKSPDSSSNGVFHSQPSKSPHSSSKIARFVVKWSFSISNRHIRRQKSPESSSNSVFHSQPSKSIRTLRLRNFLFSQCCGIQGWVGVISKL